MATPDTFKGFGIPSPIEIIPMHRPEKSECDRVLAAYRRQGLSLERAKYHVNTSLTFCLLKREGFRPGEDFRYDSSDESVYLSSEALEYFRESLEPDAFRAAFEESIVPSPWQITSDEVSSKDGETALTTRGWAKFMVRSFLECDDDGEMGERRDIVMAMLQDAGLPEQDAVDLIAAARSKEDGAMTRLVQRVEVGVGVLVKK